MARGQKRIRGGASKSLADLGANVYDGTAAYGKFMSWVSLTFGLLIGFIFLGIGVYLAFIRTQKYTKSLNARVIESFCTRNSQSQTMNNINCDLTVEYEVDSKKYTRKLYVTDVSQDIAKGTTFKIRYDPSNPIDITYGITARMVGLIFLPIGFLFVVGSTISWYAAQRFEVAAAAMGASSIVGMFKQ